MCGGDGGGPTDGRSATARGNWPLKMKPARPANTHVTKVMVGAVGYFFLFFFFQGGEVSSIACRTVSSRYAQQNSQLVSWLGSSSNLDSD